jgi:hypothetical protein
LNGQNTLRRERRRCAHDNFREALVALAWAFSLDHLRANYREYAATMSIASEREALASIFNELSRVFQVEEQTDRP